MIETLGLQKFATLSMTYTRKDHEKMLETAYAVLDVLENLQAKQYTSVYTEEDLERCIMDGAVIPDEGLEFARNEPFTVETGKKREFNLEESDVMCIVDSVEEALEAIAYVKGADYTRSYPHCKDLDALANELADCIIICEEDDNFSDE